MPAIFDYLLKVNICMAIIYLFYQIFLRKLTFYNWNRWYLFGYTLFSFIMPIIDVMPSLQKQNLEETPMVQWIPILNFAEKPENRYFLESFTFWDWTLAACVIGSVYLLIRISIRFYALQKMKANATLISADQTKIYQLDEQISPFSFGNAIFINTDLHSGDDLEEIIRHEFVHVKQKHTIDIIWCELLCILNWFNPFVWLLRHNVRQNLEFIADNQVLQNGFDKKEYQYLLLKVMGHRPFTFTQHFNLSSLKKRIVMMNSIKTAKVHLIKFMFLLPVVAVLLLSFRKEILSPAQPIAKVLTIFENPEPKKTDVSKTITQSNPKAILPVQDTIPNPKIKNNNINSTIKLRNPNAPKPLFIIDGEEMGTDFNLSTIQPNDINSIDVLKGEIATSIYGEKGKNGVLKITTKALSEKAIVVEGKPINKTGLTNLNQKVILVDGRPIKESELEQIGPDKIATISVTKALTGSVTNGNTSGQDMIIITTKEGKAVAPSIVQEVEVVADSIYIENRNHKTISFSPQKMNGEIKEVVVVGYSPKERFLKNKSNLSPDSYYVLNGKPVSRKKIDQLSERDIKSVNILSKTEAPKYYGKKADKGAVVITTK